MNFDFNPPQGGLRNQVKKNLVFAFLGQGAVFLVNLGGIVVLARMLTPSDYGLVAMAAAVSAILAAFRESGLSSAAIQKPNLQHLEVSSLFWTNIFFGAAILIVSIPVGYLAAHIMKEPRLLPIIICSSGIGLIGATFIQHNAILQRKLQTRATMERDVLGQVVGFVAGVVAAWKGLGYWSLLVMQLASTVTSGIAVWKFCSWRPSWHFSYQEIAPMISFGWKVMASGLINRVSNGVDALIYGTHFGPEIVGLYNRAQNLLKKPMDQVLTPITSVVRPALSRAAEDPERLKRVTIEMIGLLSVVCSLVVTLLVPVSDIIIRVALGSAWLEATPYFMALAAFALVEPLASALATVVVAAGHPGTLLKWKCISLAIVVGGLFAALPWGPVATATTYAATGLLLRTPLWMATVCRAIRMPLLPLLASVYQPALMAGAAIALGMLTRSSLAQTHLALQFSLALVVSGGSFLVGLALLPSTRRNLLSLVEQIKNLRKKKPALTS